MFKEPYIRIMFAANDHAINGVRGQFPQCVSLLLSVNSLELQTQVYGGNGGGVIYRKPNMEDRKEKYLAMKNVKIPFRKPLKTEEAVLKAIQTLLPKMGRNTQRTQKRFEVHRYC